MFVQLVEGEREPKRISQTVDKITNREAKPREHKHQIVI